MAMKASHSKGLKVKPLRDFGYPQRLCHFGGDPATTEKLKRKLTGTIEVEKVLCALQFFA
jgi:hypothetical protein